MTSTENAETPCARLVVWQAEPGRLDAALALHRDAHTPAVRRQPGFRSKTLMVSESDPHCLVMILEWETPADAAAWVALPEHDAISATLREHGGARPEAPRGGYRIVARAEGP